VDLYKKRRNPLLVACLQQAGSTINRAFLLLYILQTPQVWLSQCIFFAKWLFT